MVPQPPRSERSGHRRRAPLQACPSSPIDEARVAYSAMLARVVLSRAMLY